MSKFSSDLANAVREYMKDPVFIARLKYKTTGKMLWVYHASDAGRVEFAKQHPDYPDGTAAVYSTLAAAYAAATTNQNDVILLSAGGNHHQLTEMLTWAKNRIHVVGMGADGAVDQQPEIQLNATANTEDNAATIKVTGYGNRFTNVYITNAGTHENSVTALWDAGENTVYTNCQFAKFSDLDVAGVSHVEARGDTTTWRNCKFGVDWVTMAAARFGLLIKGTGGGARMKHNIFEDCYFVVASSDADYEHIHVYDTNSLAFGNIWKNPVFNNALISSAGAVAIDDAVNSVTGLVEGSLFFVNPATNSTSFCTTADQLTVVGLSMNGGADTAFVGVAITPN